MKLIRPIYAHRHPQNQNGYTLLELLVVLLVVFILAALLVWMRQSA